MAVISLVSVYFLAETRPQAATEMLEQTLASGKNAKWYEEVGKKWLFEYMRYSGMLQALSREASSQDSE